MSAKPPSQRQLRVAEEIRHAMSAIIARGDLRDPALQDVNLTVSEVRASPDLKNATCFVIPLGGGDATEIVAALKRAASFLRRELGREVRLRYVPKLSFQPDQSFDEASRIDRILHRPEVARDLGEDTRDE